MGIFSEDLAEDISSLQHIAQASVDYYNCAHSKHSRFATPQGKDDPTLRDLHPRQFQPISHLS
jgi:hypothetical protein